MASAKRQHAKINLHHGDLPAHINLGPEIAIDTEAMGLKNNRDRLCLVQLTDGKGEVHLVKFEKDKYDAPNLVNLLTDKQRIKIFHFARFDMALLKASLGVMPSPVYCTKIASRLARTYSNDHGLKSIVRELIGADISKTSQSSYWGEHQLSQAQMEYAAADVLYLHNLRAKLDYMLQREDRAHLLNPAFEVLALLCELDLEGWNAMEVFEH